MDPAKFDYSPLNKRYTNRELWAHFKTTLPTSKIVIGVLAALILPTILIVQVLLGVTAYIAVFGFFLPSAPMPARIAGLLLLVLACAYSMYYVLWKLLAHFMANNMRRRAFATANSLQYLDGRPSQEQGVLFKLGHSQTFTGGFVVPGPGRLTMANYQYVTGSGKSTRVFDFGVVRCDISRRLPNVLLDATSNNFMKRFSNLGGFGDDQKIELEGDFSQYFNVHCPPGYGTDVLYWLTPELMQLLKQYMTNYDIEVIDNHIYAYSETPFKLDQAGIQSGLQLANWLHAEFEENTHRYSDARVANATANVVAEQGRRLKHKKPWVLATILLIIYILFHILDILHG